MKSDIARLKPHTVQKQKHRIEARELARNDEIMVATGGYSRITDVGFHDGKILVTTETDEKTLMSPSTLVAIRR
jgi:preprotein translocase subunit YajC